MTIQAADSLNPAWGRWDFLPAMHSGETATITLTIDYLKTNPASMVGTHTIGIGPYNKPAVLNVKITVPAAFCGFNPGVGVGPPPSSANSAIAVRPSLVIPSPPGGVGSNAMAPALQKAATPYGLSLGNDLTTCMQHADQATCEYDIVSNSAIFVFTPGTSCGKWTMGCTTHVAGYRLYIVPRVLSPNALAPISAVNNSGNQSSSVAPAAPSAAARTAVEPMVAKLPQRVQVGQVSPGKGGLATAITYPPSGIIPGRCFAVVAFLSNGDESDDSPQLCPNSTGHVGPLNLDLTPSVLVTAYKHPSPCSDVLPFSHPAGSVIIGYLVSQRTNSSYFGDRCQQDQGLMKFDLSGITAPVYKAVLTYSKVTNYKRDGSVDASPGICVPILYDTSDDWASTPSDPRAGLVHVVNEIDSKSSSDFYHTDLTATVSSMVQSGVNNGFVMSSIDWNGPGSSCFTSFGDFHLLVTTFGH